MLLIFECESRQPLPFPIFIVQEYMALEKMQEKKEKKDDNKKEEFWFRPSGPAGAGKTYREVQAGRYSRFRTVKDLAEATLGPSKAVYRQL